jgi:transposase InsO family protein
MISDAADDVAEVSLGVKSVHPGSLTSGDYQRALALSGITPSMLRKGNCWDNAPMESFFHTLKTELVHHKNYATKEDAKRDLFNTSKDSTIANASTLPSAILRRSRWSKKLHNNRPLFRGKLNVPPSLWPSNLG